MERGPSSFSCIFYQQKNVLLRSCVGPPCGQGTKGTGLASESVLSQESRGPHVLSPLQAVGSHTRGQGAEIQAG